MENMKPFFLVPGVPFRFVEAGSVTKDFFYLDAFLIYWQKEAGIAAALAVLQAQCCEYTIGQRPSKSHVACTLSLSVRVQSSKGHCQPSTKGR